VKKSPASDWLLASDDSGKWRLRDGQPPFYTQLPCEYSAYIKYFFLFLLRLACYEARRAN
jgi:hypothetical protein